MRQRQSKLQPSREVAKEEMTLIIITLPAHICDFDHFGRLSAIAVHYLTPLDCSGCLFLMGCEQLATSTICHPTNLLIYVLLQCKKRNNVM